MKIKLSQTLRNDSKLTIIKLVLTANFLAICLLIGYFSKFIPPIFIATPFLKLDFIDVFIIIAFPFLGVFYTYLLVLLLPWLIMVTIGTNTVAGYLGLFLASCGFYSFFLVTMLLLFSIIRFKKSLTMSQKRLRILIIWIVSTFIAAIINSFWMIFVNWAFLLDLYGPTAFKEYSHLLLPVFLPFNLLKFLIQATLFALLIPAIWPLIIKNIPLSYYIPL